MNRFIALVAAAVTIMGFTRVAWAEELSAQDYIDIEQLYATYNHAIDSGDADAWAATFTPDGSFNTRFTGKEGLVGFIVHGINGSMIVPLLALLLLVVSFFARVPGGVKWAAILFGLVAAQVLLGIFAHELPSLGAVHGLNALAVFSVALLAAHRARRVPAPVASSDPERATV